MAGLATGPPRVLCAMTAPAYTILLVDDDEDIRDVTAEILDTNGYRVLPAGDGDEAMRLLGQEHVDVLFTDIAMPGISGVELAERAKLLRPDLKVLFMTGYHSRAAEAERLGKLVFKPFAQSTVLAALAEILAAE
jgi:CheY-like chemotaxis protein